jgi:hypothetical protein
MFKIKFTAESESESESESECMPSLGVSVFVGWQETSAGFLTHFMSKTMFSFLFRLTPLPPITRHSPHTIQLLAWQRATAEKDAHLASLRSASESLQSARGDLAAQVCVCVCAGLWVLIHIHTHTHSDPAPNLSTRTQSSHSSHKERDCRNIIELQKQRVSDGTIGFSFL